MSARLTEHFALAEFLPAGLPEADVPDDVRANLTMLARRILEPVRERFGVTVSIHSGYRPAAKNAAAGGAAHSDHMTGRASDLHVADTHAAPWTENTREAARFIRDQLPGEYGQIIIEDHRKYYRAKGRPDWSGKFWVHVALPSEKHPGDGSDPNALLLSFAPKSYEQWRENVA